MNKLKAGIAFFGVIIKYGAFVMAVIKGLEVMYDELQKIDFVKQVKEEVNE